MHKKKQYLEMLSKIVVPESYGNIQKNVFDRIIFIKFTGCLPEFHQKSCFAVVFHWEFYKPLQLLCDFKCGYFSKTQNFESKEN